MVCVQKMEVQAPPGTLIGYVRQAWSCCIPKYKIQNANDETVLRVKGPCCRCNICGDIEFEVSVPGGVVGRSVLGRGLFTNL